MRGQQTTPIPVRKSVRRDEWRGLTSLRAGQIVPIAFFPLLREDRARGRIAMQVKMAEAVHTIVNPIKVVVHAHLVPKSALARFHGSMETLNRSYTGEKMPDNSNPPAWYTQDAAAAVAGDTGLAVYDKLGVHYNAQTKMHADLVEAYNLIVNWRRQGLSKALPLVDLTSHALHPAFWDSWKFGDVKPSFDAALMEGAVPVNLNDSENNVRLKGTTAGTVPGLPTDVAVNLRVSPPLDGFYYPYVQDADGTTATFQSFVGEASISLANIELAKQTQAFAKLRERFAGLSDEYVVDLLMQGIRVPPEAFKEPILLGRAMAVIGQQERYATDGASLDVSVTNGVAQMSMAINTPAVNPGGVILVTMEIVPEQLYERTEDLYLTYPDGGSSDREPNYLRDYLDPQKVEVVPNSFADQFHSQPGGVFGYAPLNHRWQRSFARVGGRYKRPVPDAFKEDRQRIWAVEKADPVLGEDFYLCPSPFPHDVFADKNADPFEVITIGQIECVGNTVFGAPFHEDENSFEKVLAEVDTVRIQSPEPVAAKPAAPADETPDAEVSE